MQVILSTNIAAVQVILSTNIAETSVTVPGVRYVVDTGFVKARAYSGKAAAECLQVVPVSQAQARQRAGRAGHFPPPVSLKPPKTHLTRSHSNAPVLLNCPCLTQVPLSYSIPLSHSTAPVSLNCPCLTQLPAFANLLARHSHAQHIRTCVCMDMSAQPPVVICNIHHSMSYVLDRSRQAGQVRHVLTDQSACRWLCHCSCYSKHRDKHAIAAALCSMLSMQRQVWLLWSILSM